MNTKIKPEIALKRVDSFLEEINKNTFHEKHYRLGYEDLKRLNLEIEGLLKATFTDYKDRIRQLYNPYSDVKSQENYVDDLNNTINYLLSLKNELNMYIDSNSEPTVYVGSC